MFSLRPLRLLYGEARDEFSSAKRRIALIENRQTSSIKYHLTFLISRSASSTSSRIAAVTVVAGFVGPRRSSSSSSSAPRRDNSSATVTRAAADKLSGIVFEPFTEVRRFSSVSEFSLQSPLKEKRTLASRVVSLSFSSSSLSRAQVKPELANVSKLAEAAVVSLARTGFTSDCEAALNEQIK